MSRFLLHHQSIQDLIQQHIDFVSVVITDMQGSAPQEPGAKMLVTQTCTNRPIEGTIGGGKLEMYAINKAKDMLSRGTHATETVTLNLQTDVGMTCGGVVQLFFEAFHHDHWHIAVFGAGHVAQALVPLLLTLSCQVHCIDERADWLDQLPSSPALNTLHSNDPKAAIKLIPEQAYIISVTQGHCEDAKILGHLLRERTPPFVGVIGSDSKAALLKKDLHNQGIDRQVIDQIHCPIGLPIGADIPAEIAISIVAQLLTIRDQKND